MASLSLSLSSPLSLQHDFSQRHYCVMHPSLSVQSETEQEEENYLEQAIAELGLEAAAQTRTA